MAKSKIIARQSAHPLGLLGRLIARAMAFDTAAVNRRMLEALDPGPSETVLEVACGRGRALKPAADRIQHGGVMEIDPSRVMCDVATRRNRAASSAGRVPQIRLLHASA
jgi:ubiquinone/menaquinone biosynthesis C-methylase UbiE